MIILFDITWFLFYFHVKLRVNVISSMKINDVSKKWNLIFKIVANLVLHDEFYCTILKLFFKYKFFFYLALIMNINILDTMLYCFYITSLKYILIYTRQRKKHILLCNKNESHSSECQEQDRFHEKINIYNIW